MKVAAVVAALAVSLAAAPAWAQPGATPPAPPAPPPHGYAAPAPVYEQPQTYTYRYGSKIAMVDGLSLAAIIGGAVLIAGAIEDGDDDSSAALGVGLVVGGGLGLFFGAPLVHLREDNTSSAWKSLALRVGIPMLGGLLTSSAEDTDCSGDVCETRSGSNLITSLTTLSFLVGMVLDWTVFSRVTRTHAAAYQPYAAPVAGGGMSVGVAAAF